MTEGVADSVYGQTVTQLGPLDGSGVVIWAMKDEFMPEEGQSFWAACGLKMSVGSPVVGGALFSGYKLVSAVGN